MGFHQHGIFSALSSPVFIASATCFVHDFADGKLSRLSQGNPALHLSSINALECIFMQAYAFASPRIALKTHVQAIDKTAAKPARMGMGTTEKVSICAGIQNFQAAVRSLRAFFE